MDHDRHHADPAVPTIDYTHARVLHPLRNKSHRRINYTTYACVITLILYVFALIFLRN